MLGCAHGEWQRRAGTKEDLAASLRAPRQGLSRCCRQEADPSERQGDSATAAAQFARLTTKPFLFKHNQEKFAPCIVIQEIDSDKLVMGLLEYLPKFLN